MVEDCQLLTESKDLKVQSCPAPTHTGQGMEQGDDYGSHAGHVTLVRAKRSTISRPTRFSVATPVRTLFSFGPDEFGSEAVEMGRW